ncbi:MAG: DUF4330 family protein [Ruminococcaceae bacterium]|nr:DUF4330 family protein [Oscillospiraceae bacterium]
MENNQRKRLRFNVFDLLILALAAAVAVGVLALRNRAAGADVGRETVKMRCTVELTKAPQGMADALEKGVDVFRSTDGAYIGKLADFYAVPHVEIGYSEAVGAWVKYEYQESVDLYMTIEGDCYSTGRDIVFGSVPIKLGTEVAVKGRGFAKVGYVVDVDTMGAAVAENTETGTGDGEALYTLRFDDARDFYVENIHVGDRFYEAKTGGFLGVVEAVTTEPYGESHVGPDGKGVYAVKPERCAILVQLRGKFVTKADGYYLGGVTELKTGANIVVESQYVYRIVTFSSIESIEKAS